jgi:L-lactate dehydrogenase complex protein LldE
VKVALFIPCYIDQLYPQVGIATLQLLEKLGCQVEVPAGQTCCGQPMANTGCETDAIDTYQHFVRVFHPYDYVVAPSGSCVYHVRKHYDIIEQSPKVKHLRAHTLDLAEFLLDILKIDHLEASYPKRVGLHLSCHGLRGLRMGAASERNESFPGHLTRLLEMVNGLELVRLKRADECCGFGGTFAINEPEVSVKMGKDKIEDHLQAGAEVITAGDMSCLMHLEGLVRRSKAPVEVKHLAEILNSNL